MITKIRKQISIVFTLIIFAVMFIQYVPISANALTLPTGPTEGIVSGETYVLRTGDRYFGFTTGEALCDPVPTDRNTEFTITGGQDGKYTIAFTNSQRYGYLNASGSSVYPAPNLQKWYIIKNESGDYTIVPVNDTSVVLTATVIPAINRIEVGLQSTDAVITYPRYQTWEIIKYSAHIDVEPFYDSGFKIKYGGGSDATSRNLVSSISRQSSELFFQLFGTYMDIHTGAHMLSLCDTCKIDKYKEVKNDNINVKCTHFNEEKQKHTYWKNVGQHFASDNPLSDYTKKQALFVGNMTFLDDGSISGLSCSYTPNNGELHGHICIMKTYDASIYVSRQEMVFAHEMAHQFNAVDHYCSFETKNGKIVCKNGAYCSNIDHAAPGTPRRPESCIMDNIGGEGTSQYYHKTALNQWESYDAVFCDACKADMRNAIQQYYN